MMQSGRRASGRRELTIVTGELSVQVRGGVVLREGAQELATVGTCTSKSRCQSLPA